MEENKSLQELLNEIKKLIKAHGFNKLGKIEIEVDSTTSIIYKHPSYDTP